MESEIICPSNKIIFDAERGEYICTETGEVIEDRVVDQGPEWKAYTQEDRDEKSRAKTIKPTLYTNSGFLPTTQPKPKKSTIGAIYPGDDRVLIQALKYLRTMAPKLDAPAFVEEEAGRLLQKVWKAKFLRHYGYEIVALACIYVAFRKFQIDISFEEYSRKVFDLTGILKSELKHVYFKVLKHLDEKIPVLATDVAIKECGQRLGLPIEIIQKAIELSQKIDISGRSRRIFAGAILYYVASNMKYPIYQYEIATKCNVTVIGLREQIKYVKKVLDEGRCYV
ncbi:putative transcription initiation factor B [Acidianus rod-shaped virus 3]|uniref:Putative transcription initiation factor B n=1 Tax=Acidianus rod-shaped virus 3 TaxID=2730617 RepID=A0A6M3VZ44_9VIRU|nr:putative transcription initiation factor B [Acidianus rod-shaped virus 3]QJF12345.1 putative transcription initiation factor B [Acidianus rod-shaped virus 3]